MNGEPGIIKDIAFSVYGEHRDLEEINLNDLRNGLCNLQWTTNECDTFLENWADDYIMEVEPYIIKKINYLKTDEGYTFEIPPEFAEHMVRFGEVKAEIQKQKGDAISFGGFALAAITAPISVPVVALFGFLAGVGVAVWGSNVGKKEDEWDNIAGHIEDHEVTDKDLFITVTFDENGKPDVLVDDKEE